MRRRLQSVNWQMKHGPPSLGGQRFGIQIRARKAVDQSGPIF